MPAGARRRSCRQEASQRVNAIPPYSCAPGSLKRLLGGSRRGLLLLLNHVSKRRGSVQSKVKFTKALYVVEEGMEVSEIS